jgi:hypothetical protein
MTLPEQGHFPNRDTSRTGTLPEQGHFPNRDTSRTGTLPEQKKICIINMLNFILSILFIYLVMSNRFPAPSIQSQSGKHCVLIYRLVENLTKCYKFHRSNSARDKSYHYYVCVGCENLKRNTEEHSKRSLPSINVAADYSSFLSNPALYPHFCGDEDLFEFTQVSVQGIYRLAFNFIIFIDVILEVW